MKTIPALVLAASLACAQAPNAGASEEQVQLQQALAEAGGSPVELVRSLEAHLKKFPKSERLAEIERAIVKTAIDTQDDRRIIEYGEKVLNRTSDPDPLVLERVSQALLAKGDKESAQRAGTYSGRLVQALDSRKDEKKDTPREQARHREQLDEAMARAWQLQAMSFEKTGKPEQALSTAQMSFDLVPSASGARLLARIHQAAGRKADALAAWANAFAIDERERPNDRKQIAALYREMKGTEAGVGDEVLKAFDRVAGAEQKREAALKAIDPNFGIDKPMDFTLSGLGGEKLDLKSLRGKVVVFDFWATWCGPCRQQYPLYEKVKERFKKNDKIVFLALSTDEDRAGVKPFIEAQKWSKAVYFDEGLSSLLRVASIPTTMVFNGKGEMVSRMTGFLPDRFVDMLSERILTALNE